VLRARLLGDPLRLGSLARPLWSQEYDPHRFLKNPS
jgi:hypothetical protein